MASQGTLKVGWRHQCGATLQSDAGVLDDAMSASRPASYDSEGEASRATGHLAAVEEEPLHCKPSRDSPRPPGPLDPATPSRSWCLTRVRSVAHTPAHVHVYTRTPGRPHRRRPHRAVPLGVFDVHDHQGHGGPHLRPVGPGRGRSRRVVRHPAQLDEVGGSRGRCRGRGRAHLLADRAPR